MKPYVRKLSRLNNEFEETIREVMMSQGRRFCPFKEPKCEQEDEAQNSEVFVLLKNADRCLSGTSSHTARKYIQDAMQKLSPVAYNNWKKK